MFLHRFEQSGLCLRRRTIDFVSQHQVGEDRSEMKHELAASVLLFEDRSSDDIARQQVGSELDALR